jgi:hypothetical protein
MNRQSQTKVVKTYTYETFWENFIKKQKLFYHSVFPSL